MFGRNQVTDRDLLKNINQRLARTGTSSSSKVNVVVQQGNVTLTGTLQHAIQRDPILKAVARVTGVRRVNDQMQHVAKKRQDGRENVHIAESSARGRVLCRKCENGRRSPRRNRRHSGRRSCRRTAEALVSDATEQVQLPAGAAAPWAATLARHKQPSRWKSGWQLANSLLPFCGLWYLMYLSTFWSYWLTLAARAAHGWAVDSHLHHPARLRAPFILPQPPRE